MKNIFIFVTLILLFCVTVFAEEIIIGLGIDKPPFITGNQQGIEVDLIREVFKRVGHSSIVIEHMTNKRILVMLQNDLITTGPIAKGNPGVSFCYTSTSFIDFHNFVITKHSSTLNPSSLQDLANPIYNIAAFQNAVVTLGPDYAKEVRKNPNYLELGSQKSQVQMFLSDRKNTLIIDGFIFRYWTKFLKPQKLPKVVYHPLFNKVSSLYLGFRLEEKKLCNKIGKALQRMKDDGVYQKILGDKVW